MATYLEDTMGWDSSCYQVRDAGVVAVMLAHTRLQVLNLYADSQLTNTTFSSFDILTDLQEVDLCGTAHTQAPGLDDVDTQ